MEEIRYPTRRSWFLENEIRRQLPEQSIWLAAGRVQSAVAGGSSLMGHWTALVGEE